MIIKSLIVASMFFNLLGLHDLSDKFDAGIIRDRSNSKKEVIASNSALSLPNILPRPRVKVDAYKTPIYAKHYLLADLDSGTILTKQSYKDHAPIASTTKIMTATIVLENYKLDEVVTISQAASTQIGAEVYLQTGEKITVGNLLKCLLVNSGNDSAYALAEHMNKNGETGIVKFVEKMNEKAKELGMNDTKYEDPAGLNTTGYSSAFDLYLITKHALQISTFADIVRIESGSVKNVDGTIWHQLKNSNRLVNEYHYPGAIGVKTGYMPEAGHCLVGAVERNSHTLISIVLNTYADNASASADESRKLLDWGFSNVNWE
jgi:D-alanyl-D-alanine carboxypeptidase